MAKEKTIVIRGEIYWCKLLGDAVPYTGNPRYDKGPYWAVDITPDGPSFMKLEAEGLTTGGKSGLGKMREPNKKYEKETRKENYLTLTINENRSDGKKNNPPVVQDGEGKPWDNGKIGNGSIADIMVKVVDYGDDVKGLYFQKMRVLDHVAFEGQDFEPLSEEDEYFASSKASGKPQGAAKTETDKAKPSGDTESEPGNEDLEDEIPF